jgi:hypothetical protein
MNRIEDLLTPVWRKERIASVAVQITMVKPELEKESQIFQFHKNVVGVPFLALPQKVLLQDEATCQSD